MTSMSELRAHYGLAQSDDALKSATVISPLEIVKLVLPVYLLLVAGAVLRRTGLIRKEHDAGIMRVVFSVMFPCFILDKILGSSGLHSSSGVLWAIGLGGGMILVGILLGYGVARLIGLENGTGMRTFALSAGCQNYGYTAVPVVEIIWGSSALGLLFVHNVGVEIAIWSFGVMLLSGGRKFFWRALLNGPMIAVVVGLLLVALNVDQLVTGPARVAMSLTGVGAFPLAILLTGCSMVDMVGAERPCWKIILGGAVVRLVLAPIAILCAAKYLPLPVGIRQVLVVQAAMPAGMTSIMLARIYGGRPGVAVQVVLATTVLSLLTLPWIITWGNQWIGLHPLIP
jgi:predicted permease